MRSADSELYLNVHTDLIHWKRQFYILTGRKQTEITQKAGRTFYVLSLWCCGQLPWGKWSVVMKRISLESRGRAKGTGGSTEPALLLSCCRTLHSPATSSITPAQIWGLKHLKTSPVIPLLFSRKSFFWAEKRRKKNRRFHFQIWVISCPRRNVNYWF